MKAKEGFKRSFICFLIVLCFTGASFLLLGSSVSDHQNYVSHYLSSYTNLHDEVLASKLPMWSWNLFLGHNFLGMQSYYSIYNPFFLITLFFSSEVLSNLYIPLLLLKLALAFLAYYMYMVKTKWFSKDAIMIGGLLYLFNGWMLTNLSEFVTIELLMFIPLILYGIEMLIDKKQKRYLVFSLSLMWVSHFTVTMMVLPFIMGYILIRQFVSEDTGSILKVFFKSLLLTISLTAVCTLPILLAVKQVDLSFLGTIDVISGLKLVLMCFFPPASLLLNKGSIALSDGLWCISLYQSILVGLLVPQFFVMASKKVRIIVTMLYVMLVGYLVMQPSITISNLAMHPTITIEQMGVCLMLVNMLVVAYVITHFKQIHLKLLNYTAYGYISLIMMTLGVMLSYKIQMDGEFSYKVFRYELLKLTPLIFVSILMVLLIKGYKYLINEILKYETPLKFSVLTSLVMFEVVIVIGHFLGSYGVMKPGVDAIIHSNQYISNQTYAVTDYIEVMDNEFYRIINGFQSQPNDPQLNHYPGFSISDDEVSQLELGRNYFSVNQANQFVTTALSAKYYLAPSLNLDLNGYRYFDQIGNVIVYKNDYFIPVGSRQETYVLESDFYDTTELQQSFLFLNSLILSEAQVLELSKVMELVKYDLSELPKKPKELDYYKAARIRQQTGVTNVSYDANQLSCEVFVGYPQLVSFSIPYNSGFVAMSNGEPLKIHEVNGGLMAIEFDQAGEYEVQIRYTSPGYELGFAISAITGLIVISVLSKPYYSSKKART